MISLDAIYADFKNKKTTLPETVNKIIRLMYENPKYFQLESFSQDNLQDFMVFCHPQLRLIIQKYDDSRSSFATFFSYCIYMQKKRFFKVYYRNYAKQKAISEYLEEETMTDAAEVSAYKNNVDLQDILPPETISLDIIMKTIPGFSRIRSLTPKQKLLILTLKSCSFISDSQVQQIAQITGMKLEDLYSMLDTVEKSLNTRKKRINECNERLNKAWLCKKKLKLELSAAEENSCHKEILEHSLHVQDRILALYQEKSKEIPYLCPTNKIIGTILQVSPTAISHFLNVLHDKNPKSYIL